MHHGDDRTGRSHSEWSRRDFLRVGGMGALGLSLADPRATAAAPSSERAVILLLLVGGPSQLDTFDPKPEAPSEVRGPFRPIATAVPGIQVCEHLPGLARRMDRLTLIRTLHHDAAPIHETGHQLVQTGRLSRDDDDPPHIGALAAHRLGARNQMPPFVVAPAPIGRTGVAVSHGQSAGSLGRECEPFHLALDPETGCCEPAVAAERALMSRPASSAFRIQSEPDSVRDAYGRNAFGQSCLLARRLVESGTRLVTVNMYQTVFHLPTWDCHGSSPFATLGDYASEVLPTFDRAFSALIDDLARRGLLETTLVVATGEFGRTPRLNSSGGRDHWPGCWSAVLAGGGRSGGQVIGTSDPTASEPRDRPVTPADLFATMARGLGLTNEPQLSAGGRPIEDVFA